MIKRKMPSLEELQRNEMNIDEWLHTSDYLGIELFANFFKMVKKRIEREFHR